MNKTKSVMVTGGAGFVGAHTAKALAEAGYRPVVFDNLSSGFREAVQWGPLVHGDLRDPAALRAAFASHDVTAVIHCAGLIEVGRSISEPGPFWDVNLTGTQRLLAAMQDAGVPRLVFSSSAAVYGASGSAAGGAIPETALKAPLSPYGETKLAGEQLIAGYARAHGLSAFALRYFNASGADPSGRIGEAHEPETHLIPLAIAAALGAGPPLTVFGKDFATPDGTCLRDYIHVSDLATAHVAAVRAQLDAGAFEPLNVGTGRGASVRDVMAAISAACGREVPHVFGCRRAGDPPTLVADPARARARLGWAAQRSSLDAIVGDALRWEADPAYGTGRRRPAAGRRTQVAA